MSNQGVIKMNHGRLASSLFYLNYGIAEWASENLDDGVLDGDDLFELEKPIEDALTCGFAVGPGKAFSVSIELLALEKEFRSSGGFSDDEAEDEEDEDEGEKPEHNVSVTLGSIALFVLYLNYNVGLWASKLLDDGKLDAADFNELEPAFEKAFGDAFDVPEGFEAVVTIALVSMEEGKAQDEEGKAQDEDEAPPVAGWQDTPTQASLFSADSQDLNLD